MADNSKIEWTDATWPIVQGCDPVSPGCVHCYAVPLLHRLASNPNPAVSAPLTGLVECHKGELRFTGKVALREDRLDWPLRWREPRMIFVPSHGDLFHKAVPDSFIDRVFAVMALAPQHTFQVLTKRAARARAYCNAKGAARRVYEMACDIAVDRAYGSVVLIAPGMDEAVAPGGPRVFLDQWPLPNVWLGVSAERQQEADERIPELLQTPAAVRFVSLEPLLAPIDLTRIDGGALDPDYKGLHLDALIGGRKSATPWHLNWVIVGGESGKAARYMEPAWARSIRDQCAAAGVAFFHKQMTGKKPIPPDLLVRQFPSAGIRQGFATPGGVK